MGLEHGGTPILTTLRQSPDVAGGEAAHGTGSATTDSAVMVWDYWYERYWREGSN